MPQAIADKRTGKLERWMYREVLARMPFARSLEQASSSYLFTITDPRYASVGGKFIVDGKEIPSSDESYDEAKARRLWEYSLTCCGLDRSQPA